MPVPAKFWYRIREFCLLLLAWMALLYGYRFLEMTVRLNPAALRHIHINQGIFGFINFLLFYTAIRWPLPQYLRTRKPWPLVFQLTALIFLFSLFKWFLANHYFRMDVIYMGYRGPHIPIYKTFGQYMLSSAWTNAVVLSVAGAYVLFFSWLQEDKRRKQLSGRKAEAEFAFLKMQLNTHFLMNSLNSIYSLALVRSPRAVDATRSLGDILSYMTAQPPLAGYRSGLTEEIKYLGDYIALQRLRTGCDDCVRLRVEGDSAHREIAPLLLVPFVENAFKHGVSNQSDKPVDIRLLCEDGTFTFSVHNFKKPQRKDATGGIGLHNVRQRLDLVYPGRYTLDVEESGEEYCCNLQIRW
ncbi:sensor histidine kinase [Chitinophaga lutea]